MTIPPPVAWRHVALHYNLRVRRSSAEAKSAATRPLPTTPCPVPRIGHHPIRSAPFRHAICVRPRTQFAWAALMGSGRSRVSP